MRLAILAIACLVGWASAARADDPAIETCAAALRATLPATGGYRQTGAVIDGAVVTISYIAGGDLNDRKNRCVFVFDRTKVAWTLDLSTPAVVELCKYTVSSVTDHLRVGEDDKARALKPQLEKCGPILKAELQRQSAWVVASARLILERRYPIPGRDTALRNID